ncbi:RecQ family ATP-dependent DNA helicase [Actinoplanes sp. Pm04-4]|uniref:ATP-dependent DNA helicase RecQ n=1 Tax=Paractinoplanes pyxinae TaxID=2997416 RepID=A0ABT4BHM9_9ACTN|nr:RecQ family ATP-dependent DNA helicase [Actinoplanes pyxinae]MCY1145497.1 RecQ family ATP-dependent DNA helicase [Actinoplanes pyxinae]
MSDVNAIAESVLGFALRPAQQETASAAAAGRDTLAVLPTGSGKSAIYQVAGLARGGLTVVVSPLLALQRDQLRSLTGRNVAARMVNSGLRHSERLEALNAVREGSADFVLLGPEQLGNEETIGAISDSRRPVTLIAIDEAHLISQWGHDFRPDYLRLADIADTLGRPPLLALTATAAPPVQADITRRLRMTDPKVIVAGFDRPNLSLAVRLTRQDLPEAQAIEDRTVEVMLAHETPALVYALTHTHCEELAERLRLDAYKTAAYHAGVPAAERARIQDAFFAGELDIVVATSAFGMGIDKPDIRTVVHAGVPGSLDEYYQEVGRAGRDGNAAAVVLVHDSRAVRIPRLLAARARVPAETVTAVVHQLEAAHGQVALADVATAAGVSHTATQRVATELIEQGFLTSSGRDEVTVATPVPASARDAVLASGDRRQTILASQIDTARHYAETTQCRRAELLAYFGEHYPAPCGNCDNDAAAPPPAAATWSPTTGDGTRVTHKYWGSGLLLSRDDHELSVLFDSVGYRHLTPAVLTNGLLTIDA